MANNLPLNTTYGSDKLKIPVVKMPDVSKTVLSDKAKSMLPTLQTSVANATPQVPTGSAGLSYNALSPTTPAPAIGIESATMRTPLIPAPDQTQEMAIPPGYQFSEKTSENIPYPVPPTARFVQLSKTLGGGVSAQDIKDKNKVYLSYRADTPEQKGVERGGLSGKLYEVDHIVPEAYGGADVLENKQVLPWYEHAQKSAVQAVADALRTGPDPKKKLSLQDALDLSLNWYGKDTEGISTQDAQGNYKPLDQNEAWNIYQKWQQPKQHTMADYWDAFKNISSDNKYENYVLDAARGIVDGLSFGLLKMGQTDYTKSGGGQVGSLVRFGGNVLGFGAGFGAVKASIGAGLALAGEALGPTAAAVETAKNAGTVAEASKLSKTFTKAASLFQPQPVQTDLFWKLAKDGNFQLASQKAASTILKAATGDVIVNNLIGQLSETAQPSSQRNRLERVFFDTANGIAMNAFGEGAKGSLGVAGTTALLTRWEGAPWSEALRNGVVFGSMHGLASLEGGGKVMEENLKQTGVDYALAKRNTFLNRVGEKAYTPEQLSKMSPAEADARIKYENNIAADQIAKMYSSGEPLVGTGLVGTPKSSDEASTAYLTKWHNDAVTDVMLSGELLSGDIQTAKVPMWEKAPKKETIWEALNTQDKNPSIPLHLSEHIPSEMAKYIETNKDQFNLGQRYTELPSPEKNSFLQTKLSEVKDPEMKFQVTGQAVSGSPQSSEVNRNLMAAIDQAQQTGKNPRFFFVDSPESSYIQSKRTDVVDPNPTKNVAVVAEVNGDLVVVGHIAMKDRIGTYDLSNPDEPRRVSGRVNSQNDTMVKNGRTPDLDSNHNKDTLWDFMNANNSKVMEANVAELGIGKNSGEPYVILRTDPSKIQEAVIRNFDVPQEKTYISSQQLRDVMNLSKQRPSEIVPESEITMSGSKKTIVTPADVLRGTDVSDIPVSVFTPPTVKADIALTAGRAQNNITNFIEEVQAVIRTGDPKMVKSYFDESVGKNAITIDDAKSMIADKHELSTSDLLPIGKESNFDSILVGAQKKGVINGNGMSILADLDYVMENHPDFVKALGETRDHGLMNNWLIDTSVPLKSASKPTREEMRVSRKTTEPDVKHSDLANKVSKAVNSGPTVVTMKKKVGLPTPEGKTSPEVISAAKGAPKTTPEVIKTEKSSETKPLQTETVSKQESKVRNTSQETEAKLPIDDPANQVSKTPRRKLSSLESVSSLLDIPSEDLSGPSSWGEKTNNIPKPLYNALTLKQQELLRSGDWKEANAIQAEKEAVTRIFKDKDGNDVNAMTLRAKQELDKASGDPEKAFQAFRKYLNEYSQKRIGKDVVTKENSQDLKHNFHRMTDSIPTQAFVFKNGETSVVPWKGTVKSQGDRNVMSYYEKEGIKAKKDGSEIISFNDKDSKFGNNTRSQNKVEILRDALAKKDYVLFATKSNDEGSMMAVKYHPELAAKFDANPERYKMNLDEAFTGTPRDIAHEKFFRVFLTDAVGIPKELTADGVAKRWNLLFMREVQDKSPVRDIVKIVLPTKTLGDLGVIDSKMLSTQDPSVVDALQSKSQMDGASWISPSYAEKMAFHNGFEEGQNHFKKSTYHKFEDGGQNKVYLEKGDTAVLTPELEKYFSDEYGLDFSALRKKYGEDFEITFDDNIKMGKDIGTKVNTKNGEGRIVVMPSDSTSVKFVGEPGESSRFSLSNTAKYDAKDGVNDIFSSSYEPTAKKFTELVNELSDGNENVDTIFRKYQKDLGVNTENMYGIKPELVKLGAGKKYLKKEIEDAVIKAFQTKAVDLSSKVQTGHAYAKPDIGYMKDGKRVFLKPGEIIMSKEKADGMGIKDGDEVMAWRNPVSRKTALYKAKVIIGDDKGVDYLGKDHVVASHHDISVRLEGDYDGDTVNFMKIGGKYGIDPKLVDVIEKKRDSEGDIVLPALTPFDKKPLNLKNLREIMANQMAGSEGIGVTASTARVMNMMKDNKWHMTVQPAGEDGKRVYEIFYGSRKVDSGVTRTPGKNKGPIDVAIDFGPKQEALYTRVLQEAVDSVKSKDLMARGFDKYYLPERSVKVSGDDAKRVTRDDGGMTVLNDSELSRIIGNEIFKHQDLFQLSDPNSSKGPASLTDLVNRLNSINAKTDNAIQGGGKVSPVQEVPRLFDGIQYKNIRDEIRSDINGVETVIKDGDKAKTWIKAAEKQKEMFGGEMDAKMKNPEVQKFIAEARTTKMEYNQERDKLKKSEIRSRLLEYYNKNKENYTQDDKDAIVYWLTTDKDANIKDWPNRITPDRVTGEPTKYMYTWLYDEILPESPRVAKQFFKFFEGKE